MAGVKNKRGTNKFGFYIYKLVQRAVDSVELVLVVECWVSCYLTNCLYIQNIPIYIVFTAFMYM